MHNELKLTLKNKLTNDEKFIELSKLMTKNKKNLKIIKIISLVILIIGIAITIFSALWYSSSQNNKNSSDDEGISFKLIILIFGIIISVISLIILFAIFMTSDSKNKQNRIAQLIKEINWIEYYNFAKEVVFANAKYTFKKTVINEIKIGDYFVRDRNKIENVLDTFNISKIIENMKNSIFIDYEGKELEFTVNTQISESVHTFTNSNNIREEVKSYITNVYDLLIFQKDSNLDTTIELLPVNRVDKNKAILTESINFNKNYSIISSDSLNALKIFTPKAISGIESINDTIKNFYAITIDKKSYTAVSHKQYKGIVKSKELFSFQTNITSEKFIDGIVEELIEDVSRIHYNLRFLSQII